MITDKTKAMVATLYREGLTIAEICKRTLSSLGWKSIAFLVPATGPTDRDIYRYSLSVNTLERKIGYSGFKRGNKNRV